MNKKLTAVLFVTSVLATPALAYAETVGGLTRAEVYADLVRVEKAGYNPSAGDDTKYPGDIQADEAKIAAKDARATIAGATSTPSPPAAQR
jgi:hypothetical protein